MNALEHQLVPIRHLVANCKNQHGQLINHVMGGGKTLLGVLFAKNYPNKKVIVILPKGLENVWQVTAQPFNLNVTFITYNELHNGFRNLNFKNCVVIIDESHNLISIINSFGPEENEDTEQVYDKEKGQLKKNKKQKISESSKNDLEVFLNLFKSAYKVLLLSGTPVKNKISDIRWLINIAAGKKVVPYNELEFAKSFFIPDYPSIFLNSWVQGIIDFEILGIKVIPVKHTINFTYIEYYQDRISNLILPLIASLSVLKEDKSSYSKQFMKFVLIAIVSKGIMIAFQSIQEIYSNKYAYEKLDSKRMSIANPYISYYNYNDGNPDFPKVTRLIKKVVFTDYQLGLWTRLVYPTESYIKDEQFLNISDQEAVDLELNKNISDAELFKPTNISNSVYNNKGRIIGNLGPNPIKFVEILKKYKSCSDSTIIYSNFYEHGILLFSKFLKSNGVKHVMYTPFLSPENRNKILSDFKLKKIKLLLLHPDYFEGFSISGCRYFHVLEPVLEYYKQEQLYTRVVRFMSHSHLKESERTVQIIQWGCTLVNVFDKLRQYSENTKDWYNNDILKFYFNKYSDFSTLFSPDDIVINDVNKIKNKIDNFSKVMKTISIENKKQNISCCVYGDTLCKIKPCLKK